MIAQLIGKAQIIDDYAVVMTAGGVGYKVLINQRMLAQIQTDQTVNWLIYSHIKEDRFELYGFEKVAELKLFELLIGVSGCGPKTALNITQAGSQAVIEAVQQAQVSFFTGFSRVGKNLAQKLIIELKNKLGGLKDLDLSPKSSAYNDACQALASLGFDESQAEQALGQIDWENLSTAEIIKQALKLMRQ